MKGVFFVIAGVLLAGGAAGGGRMPQWRNWSAEVKLEGGSPFENELGRDEALRLERRTTPILEHIGENALAVRLTTAATPPIRMGMGFPRVKDDSDSRAQEERQKKGRDIETLMRSLGLGSVSGSEKGSFASLALGDDDDEGKVSSWGWLADKIRSAGGDEEQALALLSEATGEDLDTLLTDFSESAPAEQPSSGSSQPAAASLSPLAGPGAKSEPVADRSPSTGLDTSSPAAAPRSGTQDLMAGLARADAAASTASSGSGTATENASDAASKNFAPDWNALMASGKTVSWRETTGIGGATDAKADTTSTWSPPTSADSSANGLGWSMPRSRSDSSMPTASMLPSGANSSGGFDFGGSSGSSSSSGWDLGMSSGSSSYYDYDFGGRSSGGSDSIFGFSDYSPTPSSSFSSPAYGSGANNNYGGYGLLDPGAAGVKIRDTMQSPTAGGMKPAWY